MDTRTHTDSKSVRKANLLLIRDSFTDKSTLGKLYLNGDFYGHTLELDWVNNERRISCIPNGVYGVRKRGGEESSKYKYQHLEVLDVPQRDNILFHVGNYPKDTLGCILVGNTRALNFVGDSKKAFYNLMYDLGDYDRIELIIKNK